MRKAKVKKEAIRDGYTVIGNSTTSGRKKKEKISYV